MQTKCDFKAGDKVEVVRSTQWGNELTQGDIHTVHDIYETDGYPYVSLLIGKNKISPGWDIDRFVKYEEKEKEVKIDMQKKYRTVVTRLDVRIICNDRADSQFPCVGLYTTKSGFEGVLCFHPNDGTVEEIPAVDWSKVQVDTPIWVRYASDVLKRHFNKFDGRHVYFYPDGTTSFTCPEGDPGFAESPDNCWLEEPK